MRKTDGVFSVAGEEFTVLLESMSDDRQMHAVKGAGKGQVFPLP